MLYNSTTTYNNTSTYNGSVILSRRVSKQFVAPALPHATQVYEQRFVDKLNSVFRLYFVQLDNFLGQIVGTNNSVALTDAATIDTDAGLGNSFYVTLTTTGYTLANPNNISEGEGYYWYLIQGGGGSCTITTYGDYFVWEGGTPPVLSTAVGTVDIITGRYLDFTGKLYCEFKAGYA